VNIAALTLTLVSVDHFIASKNAPDTIYEDGHIRVSKVEGKGYGVLAMRRFENGQLVLQVLFMERRRKSEDGEMDKRTNGNTDLRNEW
jgi:hypothetical protein